MKKVIAGLLTICLVVVIIWSQQHSADLQQTNNVREVVVAQAFEVFLYAPLYIAQEKGFFAAEGLAVEIMTAGGDEKAFAALLSGDAMFSIGDPTFSVISGQRGKPGVVVAGLLKGVPFWGVTNNPNLKINSPEDLRGVTVATFPSPSTAYTLQKDMYLSGGIEPAIIESTFGTLLAVLDSGNADIALELEPNVSMALQNGKYIAYSLNETNPEFALTGVTVLPEALENETGTIRKFVTALDLALKYILDNPVETANYLHYRFPDVSYATAYDSVMRMSESAVWPTDTFVSETGWNRAVEVRQAVGDVTIEGSFADYVRNDI